MRDERTTMTTAVGELDAILTFPDGPGPFAGVVLVDGSGDGTADGWGDAVPRLVECGFAVLAHDKPGCGTAPGHWMDQSLDDRAEESLIALDTLMAHPDVAADRCGFYGVSQGGWVALLAAHRAGATVRFIVSISGPGIGVLAQDRFRVHTDLLREGHDPEMVADGMAWYGERARLLLDGAPVADIVHRQHALADRAWHGAVSAYFDDEPSLGFLARILAFDPAEAIAGAPCPVLALFGAADPTVPVAESAAAYLRLLPEPIDRHGVAILPRADHGLRVTHDPAVPDRERLAPGFMPLLRDFLRHM